MVTRDHLTPMCVAHRDVQEPSLGELARVIKAGAYIEARFKRGKGEAGHGRVLGADSGRAGITT